MTDMSRREFVAALGAAAASASLSGRASGQAASAPATRAAATATSPRRRPNIIFVYTDDMDFDEVGCYGGKVLTPHMDSLARDGMLFSRGYVVSAVCTPSRYNAVTGQYATRCLSMREKTKPGSWPLISWNPTVSEEWTLARMMQRGGYRTGMVGKWHLKGPQRHQMPKEPMDPADPKTHQIVRENYEATVQHVKEAGFDYADAIYERNTEGMALPEEWVIHNQDWVTAKALEFIETSKDQPFFLYYAPTIPHSPPSMKSLQSDPRITTAGLLDKPLNVQPSREDVLRRTRAAGVPDRDAFLTWLDDGLGVMFRRLDELGLADNTLILFQSDNGNIAKYTCYEGGAHVPTMARWPGRVQPGARSDAIVSNLDLVATVLDAAGVKASADAPLDGRSLLPILQGRTPRDWRDHLLLEIAYTRGIVTEEWKYIAVRFPPEIQAKIESGELPPKLSQEGKAKSHYGTEEDYPGYFDPDQLYHLKTDPKEKKNLAGDPKHKAKLDEMKTLLRKELAPLPLPFGEFMPAASP
jgi:arylsulfatase A-like enzyme